MTADHHCRIAAISTDRKLMMHDCATQRGDSGGPLLNTGGEEEAVIVGINVAVPKAEDVFRLGLAVSAASITEFLAALGSSEKERAATK
jgi:hypothetical protein